MISQGELKNYLDYNKDTGIFKWKIHKSGKNRIGLEAGSKNSFGYMQIKINYKLYKSHRLAWLFVYGKFPDDKIDHINGIKDDNRIVNLRSVTQSQNCKNMNHMSTNTSGTLGVTFHKLSRKWCSYITCNGKNIHIGLFMNKKDAVYVRKEAEKKYGFHENHGKMRAA